MRALSTELLAFGLLLYDIKIKIPKLNDYEKVQKFRNLGRRD